MADLTALIFHDLVKSSRLGQDRELMALLQSHSAADSELYKEVNSLIEGLNLREFDTIPSTNHEPVSQQKSNGFGKSLGSDSQSIDTLKVPPQEVPKLTKTQRRMSFDLMQIRPQSHLTPQTLLGKPPQAVVSNVSVATIVTELEKKGYTPVASKSDKNSFKDKIISYQNRLKLVNQSRGRNGSEPKMDAGARTEYGQEHNKSNEHDKSNSRDTETVIERPNMNSKSLAARRVSLVGDNLPLYIRKQLHRTPDNLHRSNSEDSSVLHSPIATPKQNMASSSVARNDVIVDSPIDVRTSESEYLQKNNDSESTDSYLNGINDSAVSDGDKEYILPSSFNRFLDYGDSKSLDSNESASEEQEDDEDDYLFNSQAIF